MALLLTDMFKGIRDLYRLGKRPKKYYWGFMGDILGDLILPTDEEIVEFADKDFTNPIVLRYFLQPWIMPDFYLFTDESKRRIRDTLSWYLYQPEKELENIINAFQIPIPIPSPKTFYTIIWQEFFLSDFPEPINPEEYSEDTHPEFINSLYKKSVPTDWSDVRYYINPDRLGTVKTELLEWYSAERSLDEIKTWAITGLRPGGIQGLMSDATKWITLDDMDQGDEKALQQFAALKREGLYVDRLTLTFDHDIGEGFFKGTVTPVKTRRARFLFDKLGNLIANYPILK